jgi:flavin reductase
VQDFAAGHIAPRCALTKGASTAAHPTVSADIFKFVMRRVASPVAIVAAQRGEARGGLTATAICSVTADPPTLLVCINRKSSAGALIAECGAFSVNFLSDEQTTLARLFSTPKLRSEERFVAGSWKKSVTGAPILKDAICSFDCRVTEAVVSGTHEMFFGRVVAAETGSGDPLLYRDGYFRRIGSE